MNNFKIITDSSADLSQQMLEQLDVISVPLEFTIDDKQYFNYAYEKDLKFADFYNLLRNGKMSSTSQVNSSRFIDIFEPILRDGNDILYISFSSALSGTFNSSMIAAKELSEKYPDRLIKCVDSMCASMGQGLLVFLAASKQKLGASLDQTFDFTENLKLRVCHEFTVDDLNFLKRGGRISAAAAFFGTMIGIKPVLHVDDGGRLVPLSKVRGRKQSIHALFDKFCENAVNPSEQDIFISHGDCLDDALYLSNLIKEKFSPKNITINYIGPVIGSHSGPGTLALFFIGNKR